MSHTGRPKGVVPKKTAARLKLAEEAAVLGITPLEATSTAMSRSMDDRDDCSA
jgi:hypothetical protein